MLSGTADILLSRNKILENKLGKLQKKSTNKKLKLKIDDIHKTIIQYKKALKENQQEVSQLKQNYAQDLKRYSELTLNNNS